MRIAPLRSLAPRSLLQSQLVRRSISMSASKKSSFTSSGNPTDPATRLNQISGHMSSSSEFGSRARSLHTKPDVIAQEEVRLLSEGGLRTILLNRPDALNALNQNMVNLLHKAIDDFSTSSNCNIILLRGQGRALCSGGDVLAVVTCAVSDDPNVRAKSLNFFQSEYELDYKIAKLDQASSAKNPKHTPKIFISVMDGITMGGGVGLSVHAPFRISTERTLFAMPETGIGFFPDVGVTRVLARLDGQIGQYLGMSGARISGEEAYLIGLATHYIPSSSIDTVAHRLGSLPAETATKPSNVSKALHEFSVDPFASGKTDVLSKTPFIGDRRIALDYAFGQPSCEKIFAALEEISAGASTTEAAARLKELGLPNLSAEVQEWAKRTLADLQTKSPLSLKVTHRAVLKAREFDVGSAFRFDMRLATCFCDMSIGRDFYEGVTHVLVKDPKTGKRKQGVAKWKYHRLEEVPEEEIGTLFFGNVKEARSAGLRLDVPQLAIDQPQTEEKEARSEHEHEHDIAPGKDTLKWEPSHNVFALPSEAECAALLQGYHPASGAAQLDKQELVDTLRSYKGDLPGLEVKVYDWLHRNELRRQA